jgi:hypothetical protein
VERSSAASPISLRHASSLLWFAIALHVASSGLALLGLLGKGGVTRWLLVDGMAIAVLAIGMRGLHAGSRWARWLLVLSTFIITPLVFPPMLLSADSLVLWVALFQSVAQVLAAWFAFERFSADWLANR